MCFRPGSRIPLQLGLCILSFRLPLLSPFLCEVHNANFQLKHSSNQWTNNSERFHHRSGSWILRVIARRAEGVIDYRIASWLSEIQSLKTLSEAIVKRIFASTTLPHPHSCDATPFWDCMHQEASRSSPTHTEVYVSVHIHMFP